MFGIPSRNTFSMSWETFPDSIPTSLNHLGSDADQIIDRLLDDARMYRRLWQTEKEWLESRLTGRKWRVVNTGNASPVVLEFIYKDGKVPLATEKLQMSRLNTYIQPGEEDEYEYLCLLTTSWNHEALRKAAAYARKWQGKLRTQQPNTHVRRRLEQYGAALEYRRTGREHVRLNGITDAMFNDACKLTRALRNIWKRNNTFPLRRGPGGRDETSEEYKDRLYLLAQQAPLVDRLVELRDIMKKHERLIRKAKSRKKAKRYNYLKSGGIVTACLMALGDGKEWDKKYPEAKGLGERVAKRLRVLMTAKRNHSPVITPKRDFICKHFKSIRVPGLTVNAHGLLPQIKPFRRKSPMEIMAVLKATFRKISK